MQNSSVKYILKLSIPIFFANLAIPMVGIIDTGLMGNTGVWISLCIFMILRALSLYYYMDRIYLKFNK